MKTINKIFMIIAMIILTPTVVLVAFILIADATDMDLRGIVADTDEAAGFLSEVPRVPQPEPAPVETPVIVETPVASSNLAANPPADWQATAPNSGIQHQLNNDAWVASPSAGVDSKTDENTYDPAAELPDPNKYLKAYLDTIFKNNSNAYINYKIGTAEEAAELYEKFLDADTLNDIFDSLGFEGEQEEERTALMERILANIRYEVGEATKQDDGSYVVTVSYEKMNIYMSAVDAYIKKAESMIAGWKRASESNREVPSYEKMNEQLIEAYTECLQEAYANQTTYDASKNTTLKLRVVNGKYELNDDELKKFEEMVIDSKAAVEKLKKAVSGWNY